MYKAIAQMNPKYKKLLLFSSYIAFIFFTLRIFKKELTMYSKLSKLFITTLTILTASLVAGFLINYVDDYYKSRNMYKNVALGMLIMVFVYYPMTMLLESYFQKLSSKLLSKSKKITKSNTLGMLIGFSIAIFVLFVCYAKVWYDWNVLDSLWRKYGF